MSETKHSPAALRIRISADRDKLARELAEEVETFWKNVDQTKIGEPSINIPAPSRSKARQLLSLFNETTPADTNSPEVRRARGAM